MQYFNQLLLTFTVCGRDCVTVVLLPSFLPHSAPSWILSQAENLASSNLQDGATKWYYYHPGNDKLLRHLL